MSLIDLMKARYSVRQYQSTPVEEEKLMAVLEADPAFLNAGRVVVSASITAHPFYKKLGYEYENGVPVLEENDHYWMEKFPKHT